MKIFNLFSLEVSARHSGEYKIRPYTFIFFTGFLFLSSCALNTQNIKTQNLKTQNQVLLSLNHWTAEGAVNIFMPPEPAQHINFIWTQNNQNSQIELYGPLGLDPIKINQTPDKSTLETFDHKIYQADNSEDLMDHLLGWSLPLDQMKYWLLGINSGAGAWNITYLSYSPVTFNQTVFNLPAKIQLTKKSAQTNQELLHQQPDQQPPLQNLSQLIQDEQTQQIQQQIQRMSVIVLIHQWVLQD